MYCRGHQNVQQTEPKSIIMVTKCKCNYLAGTLYDIFFNQLKVLPFLVTNECSEFVQNGSDEKKNSLKWQ